MKSAGTLQALDTPSITQPSVSSSSSSSGSRPKLHTALPPLLPPPTRPTFTSSASHGQALSLLAAQRRTSEHFRLPSHQLKNRLKSAARKSELDSPEHWDFSAAERRAALGELVKDGGDAGTAQALLEWAGEDLLAGEESIGSGKGAKKGGKDGGGGGRGEALGVSDLASLAVRAGKVDLVCVVASRGASAASLGRALKVSLGERRGGKETLRIVEELVRYGARLELGDFRVLVEERRLDLLEACLRSPTKLDAEWLERALMKAQYAGHMDLAALLLAYGANPNYPIPAGTSAEKGDTGFLVMVKTFNLDMTSLDLAAAQEHVAVPVETLDQAVGIVRKHKDRRMVMAFLQLLLPAGASSSSGDLEEELWDAVKLQGTEMVKLLVSHGVLVDHKDSRCLQKALDVRDMSTFGILLSGRLSSPAALEAVVPKAMDLGVGNLRLQAMRLLGSKGVTGAELTKALIRVVQDEDQPLLQELLRNHIDLDYEDGLVYSIALKARDRSYLDQICKIKGMSAPVAAKLVSESLQPATYDSRRAGSIISAAKAHQDVLSLALSNEIAVNGSRPDAIELLLRHGASVNASKGAALYNAALSGQAAALRIMLGASPSLDTLSAAFRAAMTLKDTRLRASIMKQLLEKADGQEIGQSDALVREAGESADLELMQMLVTRKASVVAGNGAAMKAAIGARSPRTLEILLSANPDQSTLDAALVQAMMQPEDARLEMITSIADHARGQHVNLDYGIHLERTTREGDVALCRLLLSHGADPLTVNDGKCLVDAARLDDTAIFEELLAYCPEHAKLLPMLVRTIPDEDKLIRRLQLCFERLHIQVPSSENALLFVAVDHHEQSDRLVRYLLEVGCPAGATRQLQLHPGQDIEAVTPLVYALSRPLPGPTRAVLLALIEQGEGARPNYATPVSQTTAILEAARSGRTQIISKLISQGADVNVRDIGGHTPLYRACESGKLDCVEALLNPRLRPNDGSLHAAARGAHEHIVTKLLDHDYAPNHIQNGRSVLAELCLNGHATSDDWTDKAYWVVDHLLKRGARADARFGTPAKNLLHLALDNAMPVPIVSVLLEFPAISEHLNDDCFLYEDAVGTVYSPLSYMEAFHNGPPTEKTKLAKLLEDRNCSRNLWNRQGKHPPGATYTTMPAHLKTLIDKERLEELEHAKRLKRLEQEAIQERELANKTHRHLMDQAAARHRQEAAQLVQRETQQQEAERRRRDSERQDLQATHALQMRLDSERATQRQQIEDRDRARQLIHRKQVATLDSQKVAEEQKLLLERNRVAEEQMQRQVQLIQTEDASVKMRAAEMKAVAASMGVVRDQLPPSQQKLLMGRAHEQRWEA